MKRHEIREAASHGRNGLGKLIAAGRVAAHARLRAPLMRPGPACCAPCGCMGVPRHQCAFCSSSKRRHLRNSDLVVCKDSSEGAAAVQQQQKQTAGTEAVEQRVKEDEGLLTHVPVMFELGKHCTFGHSFAIVGETPELGEWDTAKVAKMEWTPGDLWRVGVNLPVDTPVSFKYIELGQDDQLVAWCSELPDGNNMTVTVNRTDELISGYKAELVHGGSQPHLSVRLNVTSLLPMSAAFFKEKQLAVSAGLPAAVAEDLMTDRVLVEQGMMEVAELEEKWSMEEMSAIRDQYAAAAVGESWDANPAATPQDELIAATESAVIIAAPEAEGQEATDPAAALAATAGPLATAAVGELPVDDDLIAATESDVIQLAPETTDHQPAAVPLAAAVAAVNNAEPGDDVIDANGDIPEDDEDDNMDDDMIAANDEAVPLTDAVSESPAAPSATAAATHRMNDKTTTILTALSLAEQFNPASSSSSALKCPPSPRVNTKFVSAGASAASVDLHSPLQDVNKAVVELDAKGVEPVDPIHVNQGLAIPGMDTAATTSSSSSTEGGAQAAEQQQQATVPKVKTTTDGGRLGVQLRGDDPLSLPGPPEVAAVRRAAAAAGFDSESQTLGDQGLLVPREIMEEQQTGQELSSSHLDALAAAVAAAASVHYAGEAAGVEKSAVDAGTAAQAIDESGALLHVPGAERPVLQIMSEGPVQELSDDSRQAEQQKVQQQQRSHKKPGGLWKWILGKKDH